MTHALRLGLPEAPTSILPYNVLLPAYPISPRSASEVYPAPAMMRWSCTGTPINFPASTSCLVMRMSSREGSGLPDGWLCRQMMAAAFSRIAF